MASVGQTSRTYPEHLVWPFFATLHNALNYKGNGRIGPQSKEEKLPDVTLMAQISECCGRKEKLLSTATAEYCGRTGYVIGIRISLHSRI